MTVSMDGSTMALVDAQPITDIQHTAISPNTVAERTRLSTWIVSCPSPSKTSLRDGASRSGGSSIMDLQHGSRDQALTQMNAGDDRRISLALSAITYT